ncbi:MAG TPA: hypothetical protein VGK43_06550 [Solirubrobacterales bacterium]
MPDPRINCAAEICCGPPPPLADGTSAFNDAAHRSRVSILLDLGVPDEIAAKVSRRMAETGIVFLSAELATAIREIAFPAGG